MTAEASKKSDQQTLPGFGAPHIRQRLYWVAHCVSARLERHAGDGDNGNKPGRDAKESTGPAPASGSPNGVADTADPNWWARERGAQAGIGPHTIGGGATCNLRPLEQRNMRQRFRRKSAAH